MNKVRLTVTESKCRCGYLKAGDTFIVDDLCPPICHELWNSIYPSVYALKNGAVLDYGTDRAKCFDAVCPDECRVHIHGETVETDQGVKKKLTNGQTKANMIAWAKDKLGSPEYAGWCLDFIEDALEQSNDIEIFGGDSAKESCEMYRDALRTDIPEKGAFVFYDCLCPGRDGPVNWGHCGISLGDGQIIHAWDVVRIDGYTEIEDLTALTGDHPKYLGWVPLSRVLAQKPD